MLSRLMMRVFPSPTSSHVSLVVVVISAPPSRPACVREVVRTSFEPSHLLLVLTGIDAPLGPAAVANVSFPSNVKAYEFEKGPIAAARSVLGPPAAPSLGASGGGTRCVVVVTLMPVSVWTAVIDWNAITAFSRSLIRDLAT